MLPETEVDLSYMQDDSFMFAPLESWQASDNRFEQHLARNLRPGLKLDLDFETLKRVLGSAALVRRHDVVTLDLRLRPGGANLTVVFIGWAMPPICADDAGNLLPALRWFNAKGELNLRLSVCAKCFFWIHGKETSGTHWAD